MGVLRTLPTVGRVHPLVPALAVLAGLIVYAGGQRWIGAGIAIGAVLAAFNSVMLSRRVELAASMGDVGRALLVMQLGLLLTASVIGVVTVVIVRFSIAMAVATAAGFAFTQLAILGAYYLTRARSVPMENGA